MVSPGPPPTCTFFMTANLWDDPLVLVAALIIIIMQLDAYIRAVISRFLSTRVKVEVDPQKSTQVEVEVAPKKST